MKNQKVVMFWFGIAGLVSAVVHAFLYDAFLPGRAGWSRYLSLFIANPSTHFALIVTAAGVFLYRSGHLNLRTTARRLSAALGMMLFSFPIGVAALVLVLFAASRVVGEGQSTPKLVESAVQAAGLVAGGFAMMAVCWASACVLLRRIARKYLAISVATIAVSIIATAVFNLIVAVFSQEMAYRLTTGGRFYTLVLYEIGEKMPLLFFGHAAVGAAIGYWMTEGGDHGGVTARKMAT